MSTVPPSRIGRLTFYEGHITQWTDNQAVIGLDPGQVVNITSLTTTARDAYDAMVIARQASKDATLAWHTAADAMHSAPNAGADMIRDIRNFALSTDEPNVYVLAGIPAPAEPSPVGPPGRPANFTVGIEPASGAIQLGWTCANPSGSTGTMYIVERKIGPAVYETLDTVGGKSFADETLPTSAASAEGGVSYRVTAIRSTVKGSPAAINVTFGAGGAVSFASADAGSGVKLAA